MTRRGGWWLVGLLVLGGIAGLVLSSRRLDSSGSTLSRGALGWLATRLYLEKRGASALRAPLRKLDRQLWGGGALARDEVESVVAELGGAAR